LSAPNVTASSSLIAQLTGMIGTGGALNGQEVRLFTNNIAITNQTTLGDFTEVTTEQFPGYAAKDITWGSVWEDVNGFANVLGGIPTFITNAAPPSGGVVIYGYFVTDAATGLVLSFSGLFAASVNVYFSGQGVPVPITYTLQGPG
jgi:hypothetical protein